MASPSAIHVSPGLRAAVSSTRRAWVSVTFYVVAVISMQLLAALNLSEEVFTKGTMHSSDWYWAALNVLTQTVLWIGLCQLALNAIREQSVKVSNFRVAPGLFLRFIMICLVGMVAALVIGVFPIMMGVAGRHLIRLYVREELMGVVAVVLVVLPIPFLSFLALMFSQFPWLLVDNRAHYFDSLSQSKRLTKGSLRQLGLAYSTLFLLMFPLIVMGRMAENAQGSLRLPILLIAAISTVFVAAFAAFFSAALYQQLLDHHQKGSPLSQ